MTNGTLSTGYCTNVHAGADLETTRANLARYALAVKAQVCPGRPMGVGLWLSAAAARQLRAEHRTYEFAGWLRDAGLVPYTFNGFPYGDFHQAAVKHRVYLPDLADPARLAYTLDLIAIQDALLPPGMEGSISTLPIAWGQPAPDSENTARAVDHLCKVVEQLAQLERESGRLIYLCLEPEPGCLLQRSGDVVQFFEEHLLPGADEAAVRRYLRICHDVCHAAVMFETQADVLKRYQSAGISVGKVQVSSAIRVPFHTIAPGERAAAVAQLASFAEDRYLHQTVVRLEDGSTEFHEDLPAALATVADPKELREEWRVHFHVPIYLERFGHLLSSRAEILACLEAARQHTEVPHFEVETYAWGVLPAELRQPDLASGIAQELRWLAERTVP